MMNMTVDRSRVARSLALPTGVAVAILAYAAGTHDQIEVLSLTTAVTAVAAFAALGRSNHERD